MKTHFKTETLQFILDLKANNDRRWFLENKNRYDLARQEFLEFVDEWIKEVTRFDESAVDQKAKDIIFRIYRDVRFSNDKRPYKDHFGAYLAAGGRKSVYPGYYFHLCPGGHSFLAGGVWMPPAAHLKAIRQEIDYNFDEFTSIINNPAFTRYFNPELSGDALKTVPKGYDATNPALPYLKFKSWTAIYPITDNQLVQNDLLPTILKAVQAVQPLKEFLLRPMLEVSAEEK